MPTQIAALSVTKSFNGRTVLDAVTCSLSPGERTGIVGENGSGKTTLLRLFAGVVQPDEGEIVVHADAGVGYLAQDEELPPQATVQDIIDRALGELLTMERELRRLEAVMADGDDASTSATSAMSAYGTLLTAFELRGGYDADARVERALHGLGLGLLARDRTAGTLSGGEQVRLRLAALLAASPEVLLLDEPTNHLDADALHWLEEHLRARRGTTVAVSHDRVFLERVSTTLLEVDADRRTVVRYGNGYAGYLTEKAAARQRWIRNHAQWVTDVEDARTSLATTAHQVVPGRAMKDRNKMAYGMAGNRVQASEASRVRQAEERLRRLLARRVPTPPEPLHFSPVLSGVRLEGAVVDASGIRVADRLAPTDLTLRSGERLLVTGPNGAGKTTLLRVLAGELTPTGGELIRHGRIGYLPQEPRFAVPRMPLLAAFGNGRPGQPEEHAERLLKLGLFGEEMFEVPVGRLSTGQQQRLALARLVTAPLDMLLLDEPTNHLSPVLVEELEQALASYEGALVVVSHDRRLRARWEGARLDLGAGAGSQQRP
ncbi:ABC-F family ATP-binding cassette domain-containing protein [Streptomyces sp. NPDC087440]|uniref:ABC-F family ATP-binding cassette domain-containing protein n=1 Tax=Streptomyces sp. NPDC087440 TaxID=3365790 RepID=UPI0038280863